MVEHIVELKVKYHELEEQIQQAHARQTQFIRQGYKTEAQENEREMLNLIHEKDQVSRKIVAAANRVEDDFGMDENRSIPA